MAGRSVILLFSLLVGGLLPIICMAAMGTVQDRWILQDTPRAFAAMIVTALVFAAAMALAVWFLHMPLSRRWVGMALWAMLGGWYGGPLALNLLNSIGPKSAGQSVELQRLPETMRQLVRLRVLGRGGLGGMTFTCSKSRWKPNADGGRPAMVHLGRLGLWWAELQ